MASSNTISLSVFLLGILSAQYLHGVKSAQFTIRNRCSYTVWAASLNPHGGRQLETGQSWTLDVPAGTQAGRIWGRLGCSFDKSGRGTCKTGDCAGVLICQGLSGEVPATLAEYTLNGYQNLDFYDISLVDGFNVPLSFTPLVKNCSSVTCGADINSVCPAELKVEGGCKSACAAMPSSELYCCRGQYTVNCPSTSYSKFFKERCPQAYSFAKDDQTSTFTCPSGGDYAIVFCP